MAGGSGAATLDVNIPETGENDKNDAHEEAHSMRLYRFFTLAASPVRRVIFLTVSNVSASEASDVFAMSATRTPDFMVDVDVHALRILDVKSLPVETAWGKVPTPAF